MFKQDIEDRKQIGVMGTMTHHNLITAQAEQRRSSSPIKQGHLKENKVDDATIYIRTASASIENNATRELKNIEVPSS